MTPPDLPLGRRIKARLRREMLPLAKVLRKVAERIDPAGHVNYAQEGEDQLLLRLLDVRG